MMSVYSMNELEQMTREELIGLARSHQVEIAALEDQAKQYTNTGAVRLELEMKVQSLEDEIAKLKGKYGRAYNDWYSWMLGELAGKYTELASSGTLDSHSRIEQIVCVVKE